MSDDWVVRTIINGLVAIPALGVALSWWSADGVAIFYLVMIYITLLDMD